VFSQRAITIWNGMPQVLLAYAKLDGTQKKKQLLIFVNASLLLILQMNLQVQRLCMNGLYHQKFELLITNLSLILVYNS